MAETPKFKDFQEFKEWFDNNKDQFKSPADLTKLADSIPEMSAVEARQWREDIQKAFPAAKFPKDGDEKDNALDGVGLEDLTPEQRKLSPKEQERILSDLMHGNGGNDHIKGKDGDDVLYGDGPDTGPDITKEFNVAIKKNDAGEIVYRHNGKEIFQDRGFDARDVIGKTFFETSDGKLYAKGQIGNMYEVVGNKFVDTGFREISQVYEGDDIIDPGKGKDASRGGGGNDTLISEYAENSAHGGKGQDMHLVKLGSDPNLKTIIKDFNPAEGDRILVTGFPQDQLAEGWINGKNIDAFLKAANITVKSSDEMVAEIVKRDGELQVEVKGAAC